MNKIVELELRGQQPASGSASGSLKLAQELPDQSSLTVFDVAKIIDEMHGVTDQCQNLRGPESYLAKPATGQTLQQHHQQYLHNKFSSQAAVQNLAQKFGANCAAKRGEPITLKIFAFWSSEEIADNYKLICPVARLQNKRRVQSLFRLKIEVSGESEVDFGYYVKRPPPESQIPVFKKLFWIGGNVVDRFGKSKAIAPPAWDGGTKLYWGEEITNGFIFAEFETIYDTWDCVLPGVWTDGKRSYSATVTGIWAGTPPELPLKVPDAQAEEQADCAGADNDEELGDMSLPDANTGNDIKTVTFVAAGGCKKHIEYELRHPCTGEIIESKSEDVPAECVDGGNPPDVKVVNYLGQGDPRFEAGKDCTGPCTAAGYEAICCRPPDHPYCVPQCLEFRSVNQGGLLPPGGLEALKAEYGDDVEIEWIYPKDGYCGEHVDRLEVPQTQCGCPSNSFVHLMYTDNQTKIYKNGALVYDTGFVAPPGPDEYINISGSAGEIKIECYNLEKNGSFGPWGIKYDVIISDEIVLSVDIRNDPGEGLVHEKIIECGY